MDKDDNKPKQKSRLSEDVIYGIAEQLFFKKPFSNKGLSEIDLTKQNPYTIFIGHCQVHLNAMMAQFAKMKRIEFSKFNGKDSVKFYRHKEARFTNRNGKDAFSGPYRVTKPMAFGVIEYGKLRVSAVRTTDCLKSKMKKTVSTNDDDVNAAKKKPIEVFSTLFLEQNMSEQEIARNCELNVEQLQVVEPADVIEANLRSLLALDSVEVELNAINVLDHNEVDSIFFGSSSSQGNSNCCAARTKKISINVGISLIHSPISTTDFNSFFNASFDAKWRQQVHFLVNCCPSLELLTFRLHIDFPAHLAPEHILHHFGAVVRAARNLLEQLGEGGEKLHVSVDFTATCGCREILDYRKTIQTLTELDNSKEKNEQIFKLGTPFVFEDYEKIGFSYIARSLTIVDNKTAETGRSHQLRFKLYERMLAARKCARMSTGGRCHRHPPHNDEADLDLSSGRFADYNDEEEEDDDEEEEDDEQQPGTNKATQNDESAEEDDEEEEEEEPDKKRVRFN